MASRQTSLTSTATTTTTAPTNKANIVALPSLSCSLSALPQAKSIDAVSLHPAMFAQRAVESEAKLKRALSKTASSPQAVPVYAIPREPESPSSSPPPLMMKKPVQQR